MHSGIKIAISGKGGVGKTTVCAVLAQLFAEDGFDVLAIDADPNINLASAFGIPAGQSPQPLIKMKQLIAERTGTDKDSPAAYFRLNPKVSDLPQEYWLEVDTRCSAVTCGRAGRPPSGVLRTAEMLGGQATGHGSRLKLLVLGAITQAGAGCACPQAAFLKALLTHTILQRQEMVLVDLAAGVEFMGRASVQGIDALIAVVEPGSRSIETAINIAQMAKELGVKQVAAIANKITEAGQIETIKSQLARRPVLRRETQGQADIPVLASIEYSDAVREADLQRRSVFQASSELVEQLQKAKSQLMRSFVWNHKNAVLTERRRK